MVDLARLIEKEMLKQLAEELGRHASVRQVYPPGGQLILGEIPTSQVLVYMHDGQRFHVLASVQEVPADFDDAELREVVGKSPEMADQALQRARLSGAQMILEERQRQINEEGWSAEHDDQRNTDEELAWAAAYYALPEEAWDLYSSSLLAGLWPENWDTDFNKKHTDRKRDLVKAGALIAAEIDRLLRAEASGSSEEEQ